MIKVNKYTISIKKYLPKSNAINPLYENENEDWRAAHDR